MDELSSIDDEYEQKFTQENFQTQSSSPVADIDIDIKHEEVDFNHNSTSDAADDFELKTVSNIQHVVCGSINTEHKDMQDFYSDFLHCDWCCENCLKYKKLITEHIKSHHAPLQPIHDPLLIDPLDINSDPARSGQTPLIPFKCDIDETNGEEINLNHFYLDLIQCERDCETCQNYTTMLSEHVRTVHVPPQPIQDPLHIDPLEIDPEHPQSELRVEIKYEVDEDDVKKDSCEEGSNSGFDQVYELESVMESDHEHEQTHTREELARFNQCANKDSLKVHKKLHTGEKSYKCDICVKTFFKKSGLTVHQRSHTGGKPYKCDVCEKSFRRNRDLKVHKRIHTTEKPFMCDECGKTYRQQPHLTSHKIFHTREKAFKCDVCEKSFSQKCNLTVHKRTHTGEKPYMCDECRKTFTVSTALTRHKRIHTNAKPFNCDMCEKSYSQINKLTIHKRTHTGEG